MSEDVRTCPSCGAHVPDEADRCDLCGTPVEASAGASAEGGDGTNAGSEASPAAADEDAASGPDRSDPESEEGTSVFCNQCGWENPPGARYCSRCGEALQNFSASTGTRRVKADLPTRGSSDESTSPETGDAPDEETSEDREPDEQAAMGRQIALVVGGALVLVLGLFFATQWSAQYEWEDDAASDAPSAQAGAGGEASASPSTSQGQGPMGASGQRGEPTDLQALLDQTADSLTGPIAGQVDSLRSRIEQASETEKRPLKTELVNLLIGAGHPGRAAVIQQDLAEATGTADAQRRAADLLYRWMQKVQGQGQRKQVFQVARHAAQAYAAVVEQRPDDLDARTRMGETYLLTNEPMRGIEAINGVLEEDSTFVPARFQKGLALLQISRLDQAVQQFEMVKRFADDGSPFYRQADRALTVIEEQRNRSSSGEASGSGN